MDVFRNNHVVWQVQQLGFFRRLTCGVTPHPTTALQSTGGVKTNNAVNYTWNPTVSGSSSDIIAHEPRQRRFELESATVTVHVA